MNKSYLQACFVIYDQQLNFHSIPEYPVLQGPRASADATN